MKLGKRLKDERLKRKMSLREAAAVVGISHTYLSSLEKGYDPRSGTSTSPSQEVVVKICKAYGLDVSAILPTLDLRDEDDLLLFAAKRIGSLRTSDPSEYARLLDIITGRSD